jgi:23S rRNA (guanosine2251-2'-O)-methyltransferase
MKENDMIFGIHAIMEFIHTGKSVDKLLIANNLRGDRIRSLYSVLKEYGIKYQHVPMERLNRITRKNHQGIIAFISPITYYQLEDIIPFVYEKGKDPLIVLLDGITDIRNFGAIARTCECAGVDAIVIPENESVSVNADAMKTSAGALNIIPVCKERSINKAIRLLKDNGIKILAATEKAIINYTNVSYTIPIAVVIGAEDTGISVENLQICDEIVKIPQFGSISSLNVSVATSIIIYEAVRQRTNPLK